MNKIADLQLKALKKLLEEQVMGLSWTDSAIKEITRVGFDPIYGARPLKRAIQKLIENPISNLIIEQKAVAGDKIIADFDGENFVFNIEKVEFVKEVLNYIPIDPQTGHALSDQTKKPQTPEPEQKQPIMPPSRAIDSSFAVKAAIA